ncbi:hypothetical protein NMYAN_150028 [Nitrosomonas nitrosa]|uniref:Uncharacterized protein n=1 Tax=Nitrosomonas nitrosa TaxID=52442 RepID=A0A8H9D9R1_9PROT|nr:hypothetical protein NMYAN_150028 [Nitrosomonas nitrosa]
MNILALQQFSPSPFGLSTLRCGLRDFMDAWLRCNSLE